LKCNQKEWAVANRSLRFVTREYVVDSESSKDDSTVPEPKGKGTNS
jgi:hypothetical protein